jgi:hypothetical protein
MADTRTNQIKHDAAIETMVDYKRGLRRLDTGAKELALQTGLSQDVAEAFLKGMKKHNVTQIRGYSKEPERMLRAKKGKPNEAKR